jgi:hypothetical protein
VCGLRGQQLLDLGSQSVFAANLDHFEAQVNERQEKVCGVRGQ